LLAVFLCASATHAATLAMEPTGGGVVAASTTEHEGGTRFSVSIPLLVNGLGYYDAASDGFVSPHVVTLWDDIGHVITSAEVSSLSPRVGGVFAGGEFRFAPVSVTLEPGTYRLAGRLDAYDFRDPVLFDNQWPGDPPITVSGMTYLGRVAGPGGSGPGAFPSLLVRQDATDWFGPNMLVTPIPEPAQPSLILLGLSWAYRFRRKAAV
jgi:hypothetical protein